MGEFGIIILGFFIIILGLINISGNISTIHWYNRSKITEENRKEYGKAVGIGTIIIGISIILSFGLSIVFENEFFKIIIIPGCIIGLIFILYGQFKYNKGIF